MLLHSFAPSREIGRAVYGTVLNALHTSLGG